MSKRPTDQRRNLPSIHALVGHPDALVSSEGQKLPHALRVEAAREVVAEARAALESGTPPPSDARLAREVSIRASLKQRPHLRRVLNATGVVLHTNLGRTPLAHEAISQIIEVAQGYSTLEYDLEEGARGSRQDAVQAALIRLTGAEAALVVNNNAAAIMLALAALARGKEVVVSRGELVEIGGSFRIPDILEQSGCTLKEVGTTNRTRLADYQKAIGPNTGLLLKVHPSNYRIEGFTASVDVADLVQLASPLELPVIEDLGSGCLIDLAPLGIPGEPTAATSVLAGATLITLSGDKLLGGPQSGILLGRRTAIEACRSHPLARAFRIDKLSLAALEATLRLYLHGQALEHVPVLRMLLRPVHELKAEAGLLTQAVQSWQSHDPALDWNATRLEDSSRVGGGAFPERPLPTWIMRLEPGESMPSGTLDRLEARLRRQAVPIITRRRGGALLLDPRTLLPDELPLVVRGLLDALEEESRGGRE